MSQAVLGTAVRRGEGVLEVDGVQYPYHVLGKDLARCATSPGSRRPSSCSSPKKCGPSCMCPARSARGSYSAPDSPAAVWLRSRKSSRNSNRHLRRNCEAFRRQQFFRDLVAYYADGGATTTSSELAAVTHLETLLVPHFIPPSSEIWWERPLAGDVEQSEHCRPPTREL